MKKRVQFLSLICLLLIVACSQSTPQKDTSNLTWTYTYIKANGGKRSELKEIIVKNWFAMDSIAVQQGLIKDYELIENISGKPDTDWDYIVAVAYFTENTYADISEAFEKIRKSHTTIKVNDLTFPEVGSVVKSEVVKKSY